MLLKGDIDSHTPTLVRVHNANNFNDILHKESDSWSISDALKKISTEGGIFVLINKPNDEADQNFLNSLQKPQRKNQLPTQEIGIGSQILFNLGVRKIKLLSSTGTKYHALSGFNLEIVDYITK